MAIPEYPGPDGLWSPRGCSGSPAARRRGRGARAIRRPARIRLSGPPRARGGHAS